MRGKCPVDESIVGSQPTRMSEIVLYSIRVIRMLDGRVEAVSQQCASCGASFISRS